jgi:hypothetical protein
VSAIVFTNGASSTTGQTIYQIAELSTAFLSVLWWTLIVATRARIPGPPRRMREQRLDDHVASGEDHPLAEMREVSLDVPIAKAAALVGDVLTTRSPRDVLLSARRVCDVEGTDGTGPVTAWIMPGFRDYGTQIKIELAEIDSGTTDAECHFWPRAEWVTDDRGRTRRWADSITSMIEAAAADPSELASWSPDALGTELVASLKRLSKALRRVDLSGAEWIDNCAAAFRYGNFQALGELLARLQPGAVVPTTATPPRVPRGDLHQQLNLLEQLRDRALRFATALQMQHATPTFPISGLTVGAPHARS